MSKEEKKVESSTRSVSHVKSTTTALTLADHWDHFLARLGHDRTGHRVEPGLYTVGSPGPESPVFVTANYTLSFDALRSALNGIEGYILVLNTYGINVWCAAGKGTFGTDELVHQIQATQLADIVNHRSVILPQLGAAGVAAHQVKKHTSFSVEYGPVRAADLPVYLETHSASRPMRQVYFNFVDRLVLVPVELTHVALPAVVLTAVLFVLFGSFAAAAFLTAVLAGTVLFPLLLFQIPTDDFSSKGFLLGILTMLPFAVVIVREEPTELYRIGKAAVYLLGFPPLTAFLTLNFTGSTTFTSRSGVRREIFTYIPIMAVAGGTAIVITIILTLVSIMEG